MAKNRKVALLSHRFGNIGHLFMAVGFEEIVRDLLGSNVDIEHFEQHHFFSVYPKGHWLHWLDRIPHGRMKTLRMYLNRPEVCEKLWPAAKHLSDFAGAITCGGPSIVRGVGKTPEMCLMFHHQLGAFHYHGVPTFDCGVGSGGFPLKNMPTDFANAFDNADKRYFQRLFSYSTISTVRDEVAKGLWDALGRNAPLIPCGALASGRRFESLVQPSKSWENRSIVINYQLTGANNDWGQGVDVNQWKLTVRNLIQRLKKRHDVVFLCHGETEGRHAAQVNPEVRRVIPNTLEEYAEVIRNGKAGLASRIHAAIPMSGIGLPVVAIGTDTRLGTLDLMGLKTFFVKDVTAEQLEQQIEEGLSRAQQEQERLTVLRENTIRSYGEIFRQHFNA